MSATRPPAEIPHSKAPGDDLADDLRRIWHEYPDGLLDLTEDKLAALSPDELAYEPPDAVPDEDKGSDVPVQGKALSWEEMSELRRKVQDDLK